MKLYLHVGPHKTGTTIIQKAMLDNQHYLLKQGVFYPKQFVRIFGHHEFRDRLAQKSLSDADINLLESSGKDILLSSEDFISLEKSHFEYLKERLGDIEVVVIFTWRRASKKLYSIWQETIKHGGTQTFLEYHSPHLATPATSAMLSADIKVSMFSSVFGAGNIKVIDYEQAVKENNLIEVFLSILGINDVSNLSIPHDNENARNVAMDFRDVEIVRVLNYLFLTRLKIEGAMVRNLFTNNIEVLCNSGLDQLRTLVGRDVRHFNVGKLFVDQRSERLMVEKFSNCLLNYSENLESYNIEYAGQNWLVSNDAVKLLDGLFNVLKEKL